MWERLWAVVAQLRTNQICSVAPRSRGSRSREGGERARRREEADLHMEVLGPLAR